MKKYLNNENQFLFQCGYTEFVEESKNTNIDFSNTLKLCDNIINMCKNNPIDFDEIDYIIDEIDME